jgi:hypothetical protein
MWMGLGYLKVTKQLADINAAGVSCFAAVVGEQQIQVWEAEDINLWAAAWACAGENEWLIENQKHNFSRKNNIWIDFDYRKKS